MPNVKRERITSKKEGGRSGIGKEKEEEGREIQKQIPITLRGEEDHAISAEQ